MSARPFIFSPSQQEHNPYTGTPGVESAHMRAVCAVATDYLISHYGYPARMVPNYTALNEPADYTKAVAWSNTRKPIGHLAVHSNAGGGRGTDTFYAKGSVAGKALAKAVQAAVAPVSPGQDGGIHEQAAHWAELYDVKSPAALIEIEFHDWKAGALSIAQHYGLYGMALADGVAKWLGVKAKAKISPSVAAIRKQIIALHGGPDQAYLEQYVMRWVTEGR